jgi:hypothetical protein
MTSVPSSSNVISDSEHDPDARAESITSDKILITHEYQDFAYERDPMDDDDDTNQPKRRGPRGGVAHPFPEKLHIMLDTVEGEGLDHIVSWYPHGRSFAVHKPKEFVAEIMPRYFKQTKLTSFQRQLNLYGFQRITTGNERGSYFHPLFLRHRLFLCDQMMRTRIKGTGTKGAISHETEPDFSAMPPVKPLDQTPLKPPNNNTTWKMTYTQTLKKKEEENKPKPKLQHRRVSLGEEPMAVQSIEPPVVQSAQHFIAEPQFNTEKAEPSMVQSAEIAFLMPRPPSYPRILPLVMPVLPRTTEFDETRSTITPPQTPLLEDDLPPPAAEIPNDWLLSDSVPLDDPISFEGKTFHYLDACSFDCLHEERENDQSSWGFSMKDSDVFFAGM